MTLLELQREVAGAIMSPGRASRRGSRLPVSAIIKPNDRMTSLERLGIYRDSYWSRVLSSFEDDYPGVHGILGSRRFNRISRQYLADCPSRSFTLRNLGSSFEEWLKHRPSLDMPKHTLMLDMARLEWAHIEAFDAAACMPLGPEDLLEPDPEMRIELQPHVMLLRVRYPVDDLRLRLMEIADEERPISKASRRRLQTKALRECIEAERVNGIFLAVHRRDFIVHYRRLETEEFHILHAIREGRPLLQALDVAQDSTHLIANWFEAWSQMGWLIPASKNGTNKEHHA